LATTYQVVVNKAKVNFMIKKSNSLRNPATTEFSWGNDLHFTAPQNSGDRIAGKNLVHEVSQLADLKPVVEKLLETLISTVKASFGVARILPTHGQTHQLFSSAGLPTKLLKLGSDLELNCESRCKSFIGHGIYATDLRACKKRQNCSNVGCLIQTLIAAPIESHPPSKNPVGMITLFFSETQETFENISGTVLSFTDLLGTLVEHNKSNREAMRTELIAERQSIANEIHDSLAQSLVYTRMRTSLLLESIRTMNTRMVTKYAHDIDEALESSQKTVRELITEFRCAMDPSGLLHALQTLTEEFRQRTGIMLEYTNRVANLELPLEYEIQVSHIIQEALANIATHSGATHARLVVDVSSGYYVFTIEDNGSGGCTFTPIEGHYGMKIMRERAQRIGGEIKVESSGKSGTRVQLFFPEPKSDWREVNE
jgi:two-component system, NarL family, nitrate/nitrite sensor histidine kinase NarX